MELTELGLDDDLAAQAQCAPGLRLARVTAVDRNRYVVRNEQHGAKGVSIAIGAKGVSIAIVFSHRPQGRCSFKSK